MKSIYSESAPEVVGPYSQGIVSGNMFYSSGQIGIDPETLLLKEGGIYAQTHQACLNLKAVLEAANLSLENVIKVNIFLRDMRDYEVVNNVYKEYFAHKPARSCVGIAGLPANALVEIEIIAEIK
ncbi:RidA family protein [Candidatus Gracilibacteria bacterium]|nr:RidA family protein [Candidatus Gracilibacteria bacterium]